MRARVLGVLLLVAATAVACTSLLGDFTIGVGADASTDSNVGDVAADVTSTDSGYDSGGNDVLVADSPADVKPDTPPTCGLIGLACCNGACTTGTCCGQSCVDTTSDPKNCGSCTHNCLLGQCGSSACTPTALGTLQSTEPGVIAVDANVVYWGQANGGLNLQAGGLYVCDKVNGCGNNPTALFKSVDYPRSLALYATSTYLADGNAGLLDACTITGCNGAPTQANVPGIAGIGIDNGVLFFIKQGQLIQANLDTTSPLALSASNETGCDLVVTGQQIYYTNFTGVRWAKEGVANSAADYFTGAAGENTARIATDGQFVYWHAWVTSTQDDSVFSCPVGNSCTARTILATKQHFSPATAGLAADPGYAYWTSQSQLDVYVRKCAATGCNQAPTDVAHVVANGNPWVGGVAVDASYVYFPVEANGTTTIYRVVK